MTLITLVLWVSIAMSCAYHRCSLRLTMSLLYGTCCVLLGLGLTTGGAFLLTIGLTSGLWLFYPGQIRQRYLTGPLFQASQALIPKISATEKIALEAGTVWWEGDLFAGQPRWQNMLLLPKPCFTEEEQAFLTGPVTTLLAMIDAWQIEKQQDLPDQMWQFLKTNGFFGLVIPKKYGGLEFSALLHSEVLVRIVGKSFTVASTIAVPNSLGPAELLLHYGTPAQKEHYLPRLAKGLEIPCFALTNPIAGSDATAIPDHGIICRGRYGDRDVLGMRLTWNKRYITLAPIATLLGLAFRLYDPEHLCGEQEDLGITCALIPVQTPGVNIGRRHKPLTAAFQNGPTSGQDVFVPLDTIIGGPDCIGQGWEMLVTSLSCGRAISLPASAAGWINTQAAASGAYARIRQQFKQPIAHFEGIQQLLARIGTNAYICQAARLLAAQAVDEGEKPSLLGALVKCHLTERARQTILDSMDIHAGKAIMRGPKNYLAQHFDNSPIPITVEGSNVLTRNLIIFGQGVIHGHPYVKTYLEALNTNTFTDFDRVLPAHIGSFCSHLVRTFIRGVTHSYLVHKPLQGPAGRYCQQINHASSAFAVIADICLALYGDKLKRKQRLSARLGDLLSDLYLATAVIKHFYNQGQCEADMPIVARASTELLAHFWQTLKDILAQLPWIVRWPLMLLFFPLGLPVRAPKDTLDKQVATLLTTRNEARERLLSSVYLTENDQNPLGQLEATFQLVLLAEPIEQRLARAYKEGILQSPHPQKWPEEALNDKLITAEEHYLVEQARKAAHFMIQVDDFDPKAF